VATFQAGGRQSAPVVTISASDLARAPRLTISSTPIWRIGGDGDGPYGFARIVGGTFMRDGVVGVLEANPPEVRVFSATGQHVLSFGRSGRGPGEFAQVQRLVPHAGDSLVVSQITRVSVFDNRGTHSRTINTATAAGLAIVIRMLGDGSMVARATAIPTARERPEGITRDSGRVVILSPSGDVVERDLGFRRGGETVVARQQGMFSMMARAFSSGHLLDAGDTLLFEMHGDRPRLQVLSTRSGKLLRSVDLALTPRNVTARDRDAYVRSLRATIRNPDRERAFLRVMTFPEQMPIVDALRWSFDNVVWLRRYVARHDSSAQWISLTADGRLLSLVDLPGTMRVLDFDRNRILVVERDADDLEYVLLYDLVAKKR
jgi:hypothetical protein